MVTPKEGLQARANVWIPIVLSEFVGLILPAVTVPQVRRLGGPQVAAETFNSTS